MRSLEYSAIVSAIPAELQAFDVREHDGELTAKVGVAELRAAVEWLTARGLADSRLKSTLRRAAHV
jgi:hypothetical protein